MPATTYVVTLVAVLAVTGCTYNNLVPVRPADSPVIGGVIGENMARQESELNQQLASSGARVTNTGTQLRVILPEDVSFPTGSNVVKSSFLSALSDVALSLRGHPESTVRVVGHTDNVGSDAYNLELSRERALAVAQVLVRDGVPASRVTYSGRGFSEPITSNDSVDGRAMNRRVEIVITPTG